MKKKALILFFFWAFMLNVSAAPLQLRCERKEEDSENNPFVIEMTDLRLDHFLRNTFFLDLSTKDLPVVTRSFFVLDESGFGNRFEGFFKPFLCCQLKFVLIDYTGFFQKKTKSMTYYLNTFSGV